MMFAIYSCLTQSAHHQDDRLSKDGKNAWPSAVVACEFGGLEVGMSIMTH